MQTPLEGLLRPPLEWITASSTMIAACFIFLYPKMFLLSGSLSEILSSILFLFGLIRFYQGYKIWRYHRNLKRMPTYSITSEQLPFKKNKLFLGKGFFWTAQHKQRLRDLDLDYNLHFKYPSKSPYLGGEPCIHGVSDNEKEIEIDLIERASHLLVLGLPGVGKTRFAELIISQDIRRGDVVIVLDPKGDADLLRRMYIEAKIACREEDLLVFHLDFQISRVVITQ